MKGDTEGLGFGVPDTAPVKPQDLSAREIALTLSMVYAVNFFEGADMQLLPSSFRALEANLGLSPTTLAASSLMQSLTCATFSVFWGVLLDNGIFTPQQVLFSGCTGWGVITLFLATINDTSWILVLRLINGVCLATLAPTTQTLIADLTQPQERGKAFAWSGFSMAVGCMTTAVITTSISQVRIFGIQGWRVAFAVVGLLSIVLGHFVTKWVRLPTDSPSQVERMYDTGISFAKELKTVLSFFEVWTFAVIVCQGCMGAIPWSAMSFATMFVQYCGVSDVMAGSISSVMLFCASWGALLGGHLSDALTKLSRFHGRPFTAQLSALMSIPISLAYYHMVPHSEEGIPYWLLLSALFGLCATWCDHGVNRPMLTEVVAPKHRARILGVLCAAAGSSGAFGAPMVALVAEAFFGYKTQHVPISEVPEAIRRQNADALGKSLTLLACVPWTVCFIFYSALHWTYEADFIRLQKKNEEALTDDSQEEDFVMQPPFWIGGSPC